MRRGTKWATTVLALVAIAAPASAQGYVAGIVRDRGDGTPLPCVQVSLEDSTDRVVERGITTPEGAFQFDAPDSGSYRLRFDVWYHPPILTEPELMGPATQRAREYKLDFGPSQLLLVHSYSDTSADAPPGGPLHPDQVTIRYPEDLRAQKIEGDVRVRYVVDSTGRVVPGSVKVVQSAHPAFTAEVERFLRLTQFAPARHDHRPVCSVLLDHPITFSLGG